MWYSLDWSYKLKIYAYLSIPQIRLYNSCNEELATTGTCWSPCLLICRTDWLNHSDTLTYGLQANFFLLTLSAFRLRLFHLHSKHLNINQHIINIYMIGIFCSIYTCPFGNHIQMNAPCLY